MTQRGGSISLRLGLQGGDAVKRELTGIGTAGEAALNRVENATKPASRGLLALDDAARSARNGLEQAADRLGPIGAAMQRLGGLGTAAAGGVAILATGFAALVRQSGDAARALADLADVADRVGLSTAALQELEFVARSSGIEIDNLRDAMKELALRAAEAVEGGGEGKEAFDRLGISADDLRARLNDTDGLFRLIVERFGQLKTSGERVLTVDQLFGDSGERLLNVLTLGAQGLAEMRDRARELGVVVEESVLRQAQQTTRELDLMQQVITTNLNAALVDLAPILVESARLFADIARSVADVVDGFRELENRSSRGLQTRLGELNARIPELETNLANQRNPIGRGAVAEQLNRARAERDQIAAELDRRDRLRPAPVPTLTRPPGSGSPPPAVSPRPAPVSPLPPVSVPIPGRKPERDQTPVSLVPGDLDEAERGYRDLSDVVTDLTNRQRILASLGEDTVKTLSDGLAGIVLQGEGAVDTLKRIGESLLQLALRAAFSPLQSLFEGVLAGITAGLGGGYTPSAGTQAQTSAGIGPGLGGIYHTGGIVGRDAVPSRALPAAAWAGAPRYHGGGVAGLRPGEVPAILQRGEGVFTREQMRALGQSTAPPAGEKRPPVNISVNVINQSGLPVTGESGGLKFDAEQMVLDVVLKHASRPGPFRNNLNAAFGRG